MTRVLALACEENSTRDVHRVGNLNEEARHMDQRDRTIRFQASDAVFWWVALVFVSIFHFDKSLVLLRAWRLREFTVLLRDDDYTLCFFKLSSTYYKMLKSRERVVW